MRLIDADAHECWACTHHVTGKCDTWCDHGEAFELREDVKNAPTVCVKGAIKQMKHCRDCRHLDLEQKSTVGCVCTNNNRQRPVKRNLGHIKQPSARACKTGFEPREEVN